MRLRLLIICACLAWPVAAQAQNQLKADFSSDIRQVQTDSTDVFEVLATLRAAQGDLADRNYANARRGFESVLMHDPALVQARAGLRHSLIALGDIRAAREFMMDPTSVDGVIIRIRSGEVEDPESLLIATLKTVSDPRLWTLLGQTQDAGKNFASARQSYAMAGLAGARPGLADNNIGQSYWVAGEYDLAETAFSKAVALDPSDLQFDNNRRRALVRLGRTQDAIAGLDAKRAGVFLAQAADKAVSDDETKLARFLYQKSLEIAPRFNPVTAEKLAGLES